MSSWGTIADIVGLVELQGIATFELGAKRAAESGEIEPEPEMQLFFQDSDEVVNVRVRLARNDSSLDFVVDVAVQYEKSKPFSMEIEQQTAFIEALALPAAFPYIRQHVQDLTTRLGDPLHLPLLRIESGSVTPLATEDVGGDS